MTLSRLFILILINVSCCAFIAGQSTAFKYQGQLTDGGNPPTGNFQMQFKLFDAVSGGVQQGSTISDLPVAVTNGVFSVQLNFGSAVFTGADRWLEVAVRHNSGESYVTLSPREQIASSPYSLRTLSAATADIALDSQKLGGIDASQYITTTNSGTSFIKNQTTQQASSNFNISGNGIIGGSLGVGVTPSTVRIDTSASGDAIRGISTGGGRGIWGESNTWQGVYGKSSANAGVVGESTNQYGVFGVSNNLSASGVYGSNNVAGGTGIIGQTISGNGVYGFSTTNGRGVFGQSDSWQGVYGKSNSNAGVVGESTNQYGVFGVSSNVSASGIYGSNNAAGGTGIIGQSNGGNGVFGSGQVGVKGSSGSGNGYGVFGENTTGTGWGVLGQNNTVDGNARGVVGVSNTGWGVSGLSTTGRGVFGTTQTGIGIYAQSTATNGLGRAIFAEGNAGQSAEKGGFVKAMLVITANGVVDRCYNGVSNISLAGGGTTPTGCGFSVSHSTLGTYSVTADFTLSTRYVTVSIFDGQQSITLPRVSFISGSVATVDIFYPKEECIIGGSCTYTTRTNSGFTMVIY